MSYVTGEIKFELDMQPRVKWYEDGATGSPEVIQAEWWSDNYDFSLNEFPMLGDSIVDSFTTLKLSKWIKLDAQFVTGDGVWSYYTWHNQSSGAMIWDLTTLGPFDEGYVGASFQYTYTGTAHGNMPGGSYLSATTTNEVPAPGAIALLVVAGICGTFFRRRK